MHSLQQLDSLRVTVIVDNETDALSPPCGCCDPRAAARAVDYTSETSHIVAEVRAGKRECLDFQAVCFAGHGYSLLLEAEAHGTTRRLLFDGGPNKELWRRNAAALEVPVAGIEAAVLSHWHIDHSVGLVAAAEAISAARDTPGSSSSSDGGAPQPPAAAPACIFDLHPRRPHRRGLKLPNQDVIPLNCEPEFAAMGELPGIDVQLHDQPHTLLDGCFYVSGHIPRVTPYETGNPNHVSQWEAGGPWELDEEIAEERYLAAAVRGRGIVVFSACSHAGIVNVMKDVQQQSGKPPYAVFGGFHLAPRDLAPRIEPTVRDIKALQPQLVVAGHCTGWRAKALLVDVLGDGFMPSSVGSRFSIPALA